VLFCAGGVFSVNAQDSIILKNGNVIEAKVTEISPTEIRYRRFNNLDGPVIVIPADSVLSIRYENGIVETINEAVSGVTGSASGEAAGDTPAPVQQPGLTTGLTAILQNVLNSLPAIPIAGNNLKFVFSGDTWTAKVNGENFSAGTIDFETTEDGGIMTLKQTHIWPGAVGKTAAKTAGTVARLVPGGSTVAGALDTAGNIAGAVGDLAGAVETSGTEMVLEYSAGPPASLKLVSFKNTEDEAATQSARKSSPSEPNAWRNKAIYLGVMLGGGYYKYNYTYTDNDNDNTHNRIGTDPMFAGGLVLELALLPFFSIETGFGYAFVYGIHSLVIPLLAKLGYRFARTELSFDIGYTIGLLSGGTGGGFTLGGTLGFHAGSGIFFFFFYFCNKAFCCTWSFQFVCNVSNNIF